MAKTRTGRRLEDELTALKRDYARVLEKYEWVTDDLRSIRSQTQAAILMLNGVDVHKRPTQAALLLAALAQTLAAISQDDAGRF